MSCYEWENGTIKLPATVALKFRKEIAAYINGRIESAFSIAQRALVNVSTRFKGKRNVNFRKELYEELERLVTVWAGSSDPKDIIQEFFSDVGKLYFNSEDGRTRPMKPTWNRFTKKAQPTKVVGYSNYWGGFGLSINGRLLSWKVEDNNHAVEDAHKHPVAVKLFTMLGAVEWTRGSGGSIVGNDEYNRDSDYEGGGGNYVNRSYGPKEKASRRRW